jgi:hypothetical protein
MVNDMFLQFDNEIKWFDRGVREVSDRTEPHTVNWLLFGLVAPSNGNLALTVFFDHSTNGVNVYS